MSKKNKTQNAATTIAKGDSVLLATGSALPVKIPPPFQTVDCMVRKAMTKQSDRYTSVPVFSAPQSPFGIGSQFCSGTLTASADKLSTSAQAWIQSHSRYRITDVEVFVTLTTKFLDGDADRNVPVVIYFFEDPGCSNLVATLWPTVSDRMKLSRMVLNAAEPSQRLITFSPTLMLNPEATLLFSLSSTKDVWLQTDNLTQQMAGVRFFAASPTVGSNYEFNVVFEYSYTLAACQPK